MECGDLGPAFHFFVLYVFGSLVIIPREMSHQILGRLSGSFLRG